MKNIAKLKPAVPVLADDSILTNEMVAALDKARFDYESRLHDLNAEMITRRNKLRVDYLAVVAEIGEAS